MADLAPRALRGCVVAASDYFFAETENLIAAEGDRTSQRRRGPGADAGTDPDTGAHEWVIVRLAARAAIELVEIDTSGYVANAPGAASLTGRDGQAGWSVLLESTPLSPDTPHRFRLPAPRTATHVRLNVFPDGGVARLRLFGTLNCAPGRRAVI